MSKAMTTLHQFTLTTVPLEQYFINTRLGQGTGFMWKIQNQYYLVTNWHVLSMRDFFTGVNLRPDAGRPNILRARLMEMSQVATVGGTLEAPARGRPPVIW